MKCEGFTALQLCDRHEHVKLRKEGRTDWEKTLWAGVNGNLSPRGPAWENQALLPWETQRKTDDENRTDLE